MSHVAWMWLLRQRTHTNSISNGILSLFGCLPFANINYFEIFYCFENRVTTDSLHVAMLFLPTTTVGVLAILFSSSLISSCCCFFALLSFLFLSFTFCRCCGLLWNVNVCFIYPPFLCSRWASCLMSMYYYLKQREQEKQPPKHNHRNMCVTFGLLLGYLCCFFRSYLLDWLECMLKDICNGIKWMEVDNLT